MSAPVSTGAAEKTGRSIFRSALQGTVLYSIPLVGQRVAGILVLSIATRALTPDDFGMLSLLDQVNVILTILLCGNFSSALGYFYFQKDSREYHDRVAGTAVGGAFAIGLAAALIYFPAIGPLAHYVFRSDAARRYLPLVLLTMPLSFLAEALFAWVRIVDRQMTFAVVSLLRIALTVGGIGILIGIFKLHVMAYISTNLGTLLVIDAVLVVYLLRNIRPAWSWRLLGSMLRFTAPIGLTFIAMFVVNFGDQFVLRQYRSLGEVGIYSLAYRIGMLVAVAYNAFNSYWSAQVYQIMRREDAETMFARFFTYYMLLISGTGLVLTVGAGPLLRIVVAPTFRSAAVLIPILVAANVVRHTGEFLRTRFYAAGHPKYETYCTWGGMVLCLVLYFLLIPRYGMWGAAVATLVTCIAMTILSAVWTYRLSPYRVEGVRLLKAGAVLVVLLFLYYAVPFSSAIAQAAWAAVLSALFPAGLWILRFPTPGEADAVRRALARIAGVRRAAASTL